MSGLTLSVFRSGSTLINYFPSKISNGARGFCSSTLLPLTTKVVIDLALCRGEAFCRGGVKAIGKSDQVAARPSADGGKSHRQVLCPKIRAAKGVPGAALGPRLAGAGARYSGRFSRPHRSRVHGNPVSISGGLKTEPNPPPFYWELCAGGHSAATDNRLEKRAVCTPAFHRA